MSIHYDTLMSFVTETMKIRSLLTLVGFAIGCAMPTFAHEKSIIQPRVRQQIEAVFMQFQEAYNNHDVDGIAALYAENAVEFRKWQGVASGRQAIEKRFEADFATNPGKMDNKLVQLYPIGSEICGISNFNIGGSLGDVVTIYVRQADGWKIRMAYVGF
jgi:ketosteroid isomerase-like protein